MDNDEGVIGTTPGVSLHIVRVFGDTGRWAYSSTLADAANRCVAAGSNIISMSLGGGGPSTTEENALSVDGVLSIAAAGNDGNTACSYPASYPSVVSVAAVDATGKRASFSQVNSQVELAAPGVGVLSTVSGQSYAEYSGTSSELKLFVPFAPPDPQTRTAHDDFFLSFYYVVCSGDPSRVWCSCIGLEQSSRLHRPGNP